MSDLGIANDDWLKSRSWDLPTDTALPWLLAVGVDHDTPEDEARRLVAVALELPSAAAMPASVRADLARRNLLLPESVAKHNPGGQSHDQDKHGRRRTHRSMEDYESGGLFGPASTGGSPVDLVNIGGDDLDVAAVTDLSPAEQRVLNDLYGGSHGSEGIVAVPWSVEATYQNGRRDGTQVEGIFLDPANPDPRANSARRGSFIRRITREPVPGDPDRRETVAHHDYMALHFDVQGSGAGRSFYRQSERGYRDHGVDAIELEAGLRVGGYAWAREGFDWKPDHLGRRQMSDNVGSRLEKEGDKWNFDSPSGPWATRDQVAARKMATAPDPPLPIEIANLGRGGPVNFEGYHMGKAILLGSSWDGRKELRRQR